MKLSGHNYDNDIFKNFLHKLESARETDSAVVRTKTAQNNDMKVFSSVTQSDYDAIVDQELSDVVNELQFAADRAKIALSTNDMIAFASDAKEKGLRGKSLERYAQKFCNQINRSVLPPSGETTTASDFINQLSSHTIVPASYPVDVVNDGKTGRYLGCSKNPNSIWDTEAMERFASIKHGDEQIKDSRQKLAEKKEQIKTSSKNECAVSIDDVRAGNRIVPGGHAITSSAQSTPIPCNGMSMFGDNKEFQNIPEKTVGETIHEHKNTRSTKSASAKSEWNKVSSAEKINTRSWIDNMFEGVAYQENGRQE